MSYHHPVSFLFSKILKKKVREIRGGGIFFDTGALGGDFFQCIFIVLVRAFARPCFSLFCFVLSCLGLVCFGLPLSD